MQWSDAIIAAIATGVGLLISRIATFIKNVWEAHTAAQSSNVKDNVYKDESQSKLTGSEMQQALSMYKELIVDLRKDMREIGDSMKQLENAHIAAREENAALKEQVGFLKLRIQELESIIAELKKLK